MDDHPVGLGDRGSRLWAESLAIWQLTPAHLVLLEEACRIADRLDLLHAGLLRESGSDESQFADIAGLLAESRQQSGAFKALLAEIRQGQTGSVKPAAKAVEGVSDLTARIAKRRKQTKG